MTEILRQVVPRLGLHDFEYGFRASNAQRVRSVCAARRAKSEYVQAVRRRNGCLMPYAHRVGSRRAGLGQGLVPHSGPWPSRGKQLKPPGLPESGRLTHEPDQGALIGQEVSLEDGHMASR